MKRSLLYISLLLLLTAGVRVHAAGSDSEAPLAQIVASVYPNPSNGLFNLEIQGNPGVTYQVKVVNLIGQTIAEQQVEPHTRTRFDLSNAPRGVYFIQISDGQEQLMRRVVLQ
ncbi:MAG: T9SS type A sorting domain-containing protein [Bacteroidia bacterium]|nr:T9SS type A sorting domain-containing protein [Bacteroidia bacterium]